MKLLNLFAAVLLSLLFEYCAAQPNSVLLKDGGGTVISSHNSIGNAYAAIPATLTQPYYIVIDSSYHSSNEVFPVVFTEKAGANSVNTISIVQSSNAIFIAIANAVDTTSIFVFDGADWIILGGSVFPSWNTGMIPAYWVSPPQRPTIKLINGASNNVIRNQIFYGSYGVDSTTEACIEIGSTNNNSGNSNNRIEECMFFGPYTGVVSKGSVQYPNRNNIIRSNNMNCYYANIKTEEGTGKMTIDKNFIQFQAFEDTSFTSAVMFDDISDTLTVSRNTFSTGINRKTRYLSSIDVNNVANDGHLLIYNNYIEIGGSFTMKDTGMVWLADSVSSLSGINLRGNNTSAEIYHNTIVMRGKNGAGATGLPQSACLLKSGSGGELDIRNNIFINEREDAKQNCYQVAAAITDTTGLLQIDYNTYNSRSGNLVFFGGKVYSSIVSYKADAGGREQHSNNTFVRYQQGYHLHASMWNNPGIKGVNIPLVYDDRDGDIRTVPYRGADEFIIACTGMPAEGYFNKYGGGKCAKDSIHVNASYSYNSPVNINGHVYKWQLRPLGSTAGFTDIPGADGIDLSINIKESVEFRIVDSCLAGGAARYSKPDTFMYYPMPHVDTIAFTSNGLTYDFSVVGATGGITGYKWQFLNGDTSNLVNPQYTFPSPGKYPVSLTYRNNCGTGHVNILIEIPLSVSNTGNTAYSVYPNPVRDVLITEGIDAGTIVTLYDMAGRKQYENTATGSKTIIPTASLGSGVYFLQLTDNKGERAGKIIVKE